MPAHDDRPNILLIMTDQQRGDCLSIEGHPCLVTPNMDSIAGGGVRFSRAYSSCPSCVAARRSLLSGQFPSTHGMVGYRDAVEWDAPPTLPGVLHDAGYQTILVGRGMHQHPTWKRYGYDQMTVAAPGGDYEEFIRREAPKSGGYFAGGVMHNDFTARPWHLPDELSMTNWATQQGMQAARRADPSCPMFLTVSYASPHPPLQPPAFYMDRYLRADIPDPVIGDWAVPPARGGIGVDAASGEVNLTGELLRSARAAYYGMINHVDDQIRLLIGPILGVAAATKRETIIAFTSDHGEMLGDHYKFRKQVPYEPSARIPLLLRAPERFGIAGGTVSDAVTCLEDVMPTLLDMAGVDIPDTVEGRSLLPLMRGEHPDWRDTLHIEHCPIHQTLTDGKEKYIWLVEDGAEQLFDLTSDPNEMHNLAGDPGCADRVAMWRRRLIEELRGRPEGFVGGDDLVPGREYGPTLPHAGEFDPGWRGWDSR